MVDDIKETDNSSRHNSQSWYTWTHRLWKHTQYLCKFTLDKAQHWKMWTQSSTLNQEAICNRFLLRKVKSCLSSEVFITYTLQLSSSTWPTHTDSFIFFFGVLFLILCVCVCFEKCWVGREVGKIDPSPNLVLLQRWRQLVPSKHCIPFFKNSWKGPPWCHWILFF